jgi:hypothetical protein
MHGTHERTLIMLETLPPDIVNAIPPKWLVYATAGWLLLQNVGRIFQAIRGGGGLLGIWNGLIYGTNENTPAQTKTLDAVKATKVS